MGYDLQVRATGSFLNVSYLVSASSLVGKLLNKVGIGTGAWLYFIYFFAVHIRVVVNGSKLVRAFSNGLSFKKESQTEHTVLWMLLWCNILA